MSLGALLGNYTSKTIDIAPLVYARIIFGLLIIVSTARFVALGWIEEQYILPKIHFSYWGFHWLPADNPSLIYMAFAILFLSAIGVTIGFKYRISAALLFLSFTYIELLDKTYYLNHYYFVSIFALLLLLLPAHRSFSYDAKRNPATILHDIPQLYRDVLLLQIGIVYFYAGIAKIQYSWLFEAMPLSIWLPAHSDFPLIGNALALRETAFVLSWSGMIFDVSAPFFLLWKKSRPYAYCSVVIFHAMTGLLFQIGVFPIVMIFLTPLFFSVDWHKKKIQRIQLFFQKIFPKNLPASTLESTCLPMSISRTMCCIFLVHIAIQLLFPFRHIFYSGNLLWTEEGYRFGWRVMLMEKSGSAVFYITDKKNRQTRIVDNRDFLNAHQEKQMSMQPDMILQFAHYLHKYYLTNNKIDMEIRTHSYVTLNGSASRLLIDSTIDLTQVVDDCSEKSWIVRYND